MPNLIGEVLPKIPLKLERKEDLIYYDGPLCMRFADEKGENYIYNWTDCDGECARWIVMRISAADYQELIDSDLMVQRFVPAKSADPYVLFHDIYENKEIVTKVLLTDIPQEYQSRL